MEVNIADRIKIQQIVQRCVSTLFDDAPIKIKVEFRTGMGKYAGLVYSGEQRVILNEGLFLRNKAYFFSDIVPHEVAHILQEILYPEERAHHGTGWKEIMKLLGVAPNPYHNLDVSAVDGKLFRYSCCCESGFLFHFLTQAEHNKIQSGATKYECKLCRTRAIFYPQGDN